MNDRQNPPDLQPRPPLLTQKLGESASVDHLSLQVIARARFVQRNGIPKLRDAVRCQTGQELQYQPQAVLGDVQASAQRTARKRSIHPLLRETRAIVDDCTRAQLIEIISLLAAESTRIKRRVRAFCNGEPPTQVDLDDAADFEGVDPDYNLEAAVVSLRRAAVLVR